MDPLCEQVHAFADGELPTDEAERFREHLCDCGRCQRELRDIARLGALAAVLRRRGAGQADAAEVSPLRPAAPRRAFLRRSIPRVAMALAAAAAVVVGLIASR